jgi:thymidylate kinase
MGKETNCRRIALIGLDGSGKSANIEKMKMDIDYQKYKFVWVRWKPTLLKPAYWMLNRKISNRINNNQEEISTSSVLNENYKAKAGIKEKIFNKPIVRAIWIQIAVLDYFIQFYAKTIKLIVEKNDIIFDRFFLDLFVDQGISFGYTPEQVDKLIKKYQKLFPRINQIIYIRVAPEICLQRKNDIPNMAYLLKRYVIYEYLSQSSKWMSIDGELTFDTVNKNIKQIIME